MNNEMKRVIAIHDLSCMGRCSLTVVLPILSATGIETIALPTALLSTHTSGFTNFTNLDLTTEDKLITNHWATIPKRRLNAIYSGYLGSNEQIEATSKFIDDFKQSDTLVVIDPVMADNGKLYPVFDEEYAKRLSILSTKADIIIPNVTEAAIVANQPYPGKIQTKEQIEMIIDKLIDKGINSVVITSCSLQKGEIGIATKEKGKEMKMYFQKEIEGYYHGTGDVFGSAFLASYLNNNDLYDSAVIASHYIVDAINQTIDKEDFDPKYGVNFELAIPNLLKQLKKVDK